MKNNLFDKLKPEYKNIFEEKLKGEYPNYTKTITDYLKKEESIINVTYMVAGMICSMLGVQLSHFLLIFEDEDVTPKKEYCDTCEGEGKFSLSSCCGAEPRSNGDMDTKDIGICPECGDHCDYDMECKDCNGTGYKN